MYTLPILIADIGQVIQIALVLLFILGPLLFRLFGGSERQADRTLPRRSPQKPPSPADSEVESFLQRANAQRGGEAPMAMEVVPPRRSRQARRSQKVGSEADLIIEADVLPQDGLQTRIGSSINTSDFDERAEELGDRVERSDDMMQAHLHGVFDHRVGSLSQTPASVATSNVTPAPEESSGTQATGDATAPTGRVASDLFARLRSPQGMRDAIVLREILERPDQRW